MTKEQEEQGFRVTDKRGFREDAEPPKKDGPEKTAGNADASQAPSSSEKPRSSGEAQSLPPINFSSYILGYYYQGAALLGEIPNPLTNKTEEDLEAAQNIIDLLSMLEQKTKGNLSSDEQQLLEGVLYELRMKFMAKTNRIKY